MDYNRTEMAHGSASMSNFGSDIIQETLFKIFEWVSVCGIEDLVCIAVLDITIFCEFKSNIFNLIPFGGAHGVACRL